MTAATAHRVAVMRGGRILELQPTRDLFTHPREAYTKALLAAVPTMKTDRTRPLATLSGVR